MVAHQVRSKQVILTMDMIGTDLSSLSAYSYVRAHTPRLPALARVG